MLDNVNNVNKSKERLIESRILVGKNHTSIRFKGYFSHYLITPSVLFIFIKNLCIYLIFYHCIQELFLFYFIYF